MSERHALNIFCRLIQRKSISSSLLSSSWDWIQSAESGKMKQLAIRISTRFGIWCLYDEENSKAKLYQRLSYFLNLVVDLSV